MLNLTTSLLHPSLLLQDILLQMYDFNHKPEHWNVKNVGYYRQNKKNDVHAWGGGRTRRLLGAAYTLAFLCLLRFDEVLKIQVQDIKIILKEKMKVTLPFRKTHQFGGRKFSLAVPILQLSLLGRYQTLLSVLAP
jgi:hypothetical protein